MPSSEQPETATDRMRELGSSFDISNANRPRIPAGLEEKLRAEPAQVFAYHGAWEFSGRVWFEDGQFHEEVRRYGTLRAVVSADTLEGLVEEVNDRFGRE